MRAGTAESVIEIEMAEGGIEIVAPEQADNPPSKPNAFRTAAWTRNHTGGFGQFVGSALTVLARFAGGARCRLGIAALGERRRNG